MTDTQKIIKALAIALAVFLIFVAVGSIVWGVSIVVSLDDISETPEIVEVEGEIRSIDLELSATSLTIQLGDTFRVETNNERIDFRVEDGTLHAEEREYGLFGVHDTTEAILILTVPSDQVFLSAEISSGAGHVYIEALTADRVDFEFGAGDVQIDALTTTTSTDVEGGAGQLSILSGLISDLDLDMGVGALTLRAAFLGTSSIDCGVGKCDITLIGSTEDYTISASRGLGKISIDGETVSSDVGSTGTGENRLSVSGGIGEIRIVFAAE